MTAQRTSTAADVAAALSMSESTINRHARNDLIPFGYSATGSRRRYDIAEVRAALEARAQLPVAPPVRDRGPRRRVVDATDLEAWAGRMAAEQELPELVRLLLAGSGARLTRLEIRTGDGVGLPEWDGLVEAATQTRHVPSGVSVWEMGRNEDIVTKANADYTERTANPLGLDPADTTFVFVTPRGWPTRATWETEKRKDGVWKDVRAYERAISESSTVLHSGFDQGCW